MLNISKFIKGQFSFQAEQNIINLEDVNQPAINQEFQLSKSVSCINSHKYLYQKKLIQILSKKTPEYRSDRQCRKIADLLKQLSYFKCIAHNTKALILLASHLEYKKFQKDEKIYQMNQAANCFYILLRGKVDITLCQKIDQQQVQSFTQLEQFNRQKINQNYISVASVPLGDLKTAEKLKIKASEEVSDELEGIRQEIICEIREGECFGQMTTGQVSRRGTNAVAAEICHLIIIKKASYDLIFNLQLKTENKIKYQFLKTLPLFELFNRQLIESIVFLLDEIHFSYNSHMYKQQSPLTHIFIIKQGEFCLQKKIDLIKQQLSNSTQIESLKVKRNLKKNVILKNVYPGEILCDSDAFFKLNLFQQSCICKSQSGTAYIIKKQKFLQHISKSLNYFQRIKSYFYQRAQRKNEDFLIKTKLHSQNELFREFTKSLNRLVNRNEKSCIKQNELNEIKDRKDNFIRYLNDTIGFERSYKPHKFSASQLAKSKRFFLKRNSKNSESIINDYKNRTVQLIPNRAKQITQIVDYKTKYQKIRPKTLSLLFDVNDIGSTFLSANKRVLIANR